jgi:hypothetical protein
VIDASRSDSGRAHLIVEREHAPTERIGPKLVLDGRMHLRRLKTVYPPPCLSDGIG